MQKTSSNLLSDTERMNRFERSQFPQTAVPLRRPCFGWDTNRSGNCVRPEPQNSTAALPDAQRVLDDPTLLNEALQHADNKSAYPISALTWFLVPVPAAKDRSRFVVREFLNWGANVGAGVLYRTSIRTSSPSVGSKRSLKRLPNLYNRNQHLHQVVTAPVPSVAIIADGATL